MTDKPRLIDADKLIKQLQDNRDLFAEDKVGSPSYNMGRIDSYHTMITWINNGHFDPDPPQQPDIQVGGRNWAEVARGLYNDYVAAQSLIQQKDAEIYHLKKSIEALLMHREAQVHREPELTRVHPEQASFLQGKGDKL
jgi:hypothetical protein